MDAKQTLILVIEDDEHIGQILIYMLERQGYRTLLATDGLAARKAIEDADELPSLVLLDVMLPYIDGFEVVRLIRARPEWKDVPVLMLTAKHTEQDIVRALDAGANDYVVKPFQPNELLARVRRYLREQQ
ncbi:response regulator transcription factor [Massilia sp. MB5]|uniref:response regulator transcription factor n=1 Tax=unclassified Massilia TaxID=2609279 RepID=UPI00067E0E7B|nr:MULTISPECIES: response regulator transcription factor [unclassified Massilia]AKU21493.1 chemotaxis protein CheY [Massilia sp. NR 4-1]UMR28930.1 response regulator transcription factor [Massilia sp. MB5]